MADTRKLVDKETADEAARKVISDIQNVVDRLYRCSEDLGAKLRCLREACTEDPEHHTLNEFLYDFGNIEQKFQALSKQNRMTKILLAMLDIDPNT